MTLARLMHRNVNIHFDVYLFMNPNEYIGALSTFTTEFFIGETTHTDQYQYNVSKTLHNRIRWGYIFQEKKKRAYL